MLKYCCLLLVVFLSHISSVVAQQDTLTARQEQVRKVLAMSLADFREYQNGLKQYGRQLMAIRKDTHMSDSAKAKAIGQVHTGIQAYQQQHLSAEQLNRLREFEQNNPQGAPARFRRQMQEHEARMKKAGTQTLRDTLH